jgi:Kef-type K+ transport system membrane component KefB
VIAHPLYLVLGSLLLSATAAALTLRLLRWFGRRPNVQFTLVVGAVLGAVALSNLLRLSVPLTLLAYGVFTRIFDHDRRFVSFRLGEGAMLLVVMLFALSALSLDFSGWRRVLGSALALALARFAGKALAVTLLARPSGLGWRKAVLLAAGLTPLSALGLILFLDVVALYPQIAAEVGPTLHVAIAVLALAGPVATQFAIRRAGEAAEQP